ncbi:putative aminoadipate reductase [Suillus paluster]|uniref:putative aminoadipate reductase n=1 Tax=Suillus paluster TaxID=48578 RepID=UPI001B873A75|nr:putative aminoadipate reductase [Suillus paluster]KAG1726867.1 putative aminoadipate reductase [Suillus paluster]
MAAAISPKPECPPLDGSLLFPDIIDFHMQRNASLPMYIFPDPQTGALTSISYREFGRATHRIAHALRPRRAGAEGEVTAIVVHTDTLLYTTLIAGLMIAGIVPFPMSPRNPPQAIVDLLLRTSCRRIASISPNHAALLDDVRRLMGNSGSALTIFEIPPISEIYPHLGNESLAHPFVPYPKRSTITRITETVLYMHSSGSTGFPKPIAQNHRGQLSWLNAPLLWQYRNYPSVRLGVMALPPFHIFGVAAQLYAMLIGVTATLYAPTSVRDRRTLPTIPTSDNMIECIRQTGTNIVLCVPYHLEQWADSAEALRVLRKIGYVVYGGGPLSEKKGDFLTAAGIPLAQLYGATECGPVSILPPRDSVVNGNPYWQWVEFSDTVNIRWAPHDLDLYECQVLVRVKTQSKPCAGSPSSQRSDKLQPSIENLPDVQGYATNDLFVRHPTEKQLWKIVSRADDVIVLSSGEKTVPSQMETIIGCCPYVNGAVMFGRERNQVGLLIEPTEDHFIDVDNEEQVAQFRNRIWSYVEDANDSVPTYSRIFKEMILVARRDKPVSRTMKGTIQRKAALQAYEQEINALYDVVGLSHEVGDNTLPSQWTQIELESWLLSQAVNVRTDLNPIVDLFAQGFDSLSATYLRNRLISALRRSSEPGMQKISSLITQNIIFENPTIQSLARKVAALIKCSNGTPVDSVRDAHIKGIGAMIEKYSAEFLKLDSGSMERPTKRARLDGGRVVLLTGSTGTLGSYMLADLLGRPEVSTVYLLNRFSAASGTYSSLRQLKAFEERGLNTRLLTASRKIFYLEGDISQDSLGLAAPTYERLKCSVTMIIHNAWRLDFNLALSSFEPNIRGTRMLLDLALASTHAASLRFVFVSSIGSVLGRDPSQGPVPEDLLCDPVMAIGSGYGESKHVAEQIITRSGLQATSLRVGQIAGGPTGAWATTDWVPILVKSSLALGSLPNLPGVVSWTPADRVAAAALDVALSETYVPLVNMTHPRPVQWQTIFEGVRDALAASGKTSHSLPLEPYSDWMQKLEQRAHGAKERDFNELPALKILPFFRGFLQPDAETNSSDAEAGNGLRFATDKACSLSNTMRLLATRESEWVGPSHAQAWVEYWKSKGFLQ